MVKSFVRLILCLLSVCSAEAPAQAQSFFDLHARSITFTSTTGPQILSGTGVPSASVPNGSIYLRVTTGTSTLYCRQDSAWVVCGGSSAAPTTATYITETADGTLSAEFALGSLATGILKNTTTTGVPSIATAGTDYVKPAVGTAGTLIPDADGTRDLGDSTHHWAVSFIRRLIGEGFTTSDVTVNSIHQANGEYNGVGGSLATGFQSLAVNLGATVSTDVTAGTYQHFAGANVGVSTFGSHRFQTTTGAYFYNNTNATETFDTFSNTTAGGLFGIITDAYAGGTGAIGTMASHLCWGGTKAGSSGTNFYCNYVPRLYEEAGTFTNFVANQVDDLNSMAGFSNVWAFRYSAPSSHTFGVKSDGAVTLYGVSYLFPTADGVGCLHSDGASNLSWGSCSGTSGYTTVAEEGSNLTARATLNFIGTAVTCVDNSGATRTDCTVNASGYATVQNEGSDLTARAKINFIGNGVNCVDNGGATKTDCTITLPDRLMGLTVDGGGSAITSGVKGFIIAPMAGTISKVTLLSTDASATACTIQFDIFQDTFANYPPTAAGDTILGTKPALSTANSYQDSTLSGWTSSVTAGRIYGFSVDASPTPTCTRVTLMLTITP